MSENLTGIEGDHKILVDRFLEPAEGTPARPALINAIAIGTQPDDGSNKESLFVFLDPAASECEEAGILNDAKGRVGSAVQAVRAGPFEGLQAASGASIFPLDQDRYNIPPVGAGTFGPIAVAGGKRYVVSSNHVLANNGRTPVGTNVYFPGPVVNATGGAVIAAFTDYVSLTPPGWPLERGSGAANTVDCAWAELPQGVVPGPVNLLSPPATTGTPVRKVGRTTGQTDSKIRFRNWRGFVDFSFGTYYFVDQFGTYEKAGTDPFAAPGDSGSLVTKPGPGPTLGVGLVFALGYDYSLAGDFRGYVILICRLELVAQQMGAKLGTPVSFHA